MPSVFIRVNSCLSAVAWRVGGGMDSSKRRNAIRHGEPAMCLCCGEFFGPFDELGLRVQNARCLFQLCSE